MLSSSIHGVIKGRRSFDMIVYIENPNKCLAFHTDQLSDQSCVWVTTNNQSWPFSSPSSRCDQLSNAFGTVPAVVCLELCVSYCLFIPPSDFKHPGLSWHGSGTPPCLGGEGAGWLLSLTWLSSNVPAAVWSQTQGSGTSPRATTSPYHLFLSVLCTLWLPNFISAGILLAVHSVLWKIG